jgi:hypothetical protein
MEGPVEFSVLGLPTDHGTDQFCVSGESSTAGAQAGGTARSRPTGGCHIFHEDPPALAEFATGVEDPDFEHVFAAGSNRRFAGEPKSFDFREYYIGEHSSLEDGH